MTIHELPSDHRAGSRADRRETMLTLLLAEQSRVVRSRRIRRRVALGTVATLIAATIATAVFRPIPRRTSTPDRLVIAADSPRVDPIFDGAAWTNIVRVGGEAATWTRLDAHDAPVRLAVGESVPRVDDDTLLDHLAAAGQPKGLILIGGEAILLATAQ